MDTIELIEGMDTAIPRTRLTDRAARALAADPRFDCEKAAPGTDTPHRLRSLGWVGHFRVEDTVVVVTPRQPATNIFAMLDIAYGLGRNRLLQSELGIAAIADLFQRAAAILADEARDRIDRGLYRRHVERAADLCFDPNPAESGGRFAMLVRQDPYLRCRYDDNTAVLQDNQILLWALYAASKARLKDAAVDHAVRRGYRSLAGSLDLSDANASDGIGRFYRHLGAEQRLLHGLCRLILEHSGPALPVGASAFVPFALNMPTLFRAFVARWLKANLPKRYRMREDYAARVRPNALLAFRADIVIEDRAQDRPLMVLDTQYQHASEPAVRELRRTTPAAAETGAAIAVIIHPSTPRQVKPIQIGAIPGRSVGFDLDRPLAEAGADFLRRLQLSE